MALIEYNLFGKQDKVAIAIGRLQTFEPPEGYYLAFSGGKDSCVIKALAEMAKVKHEVYYHNTTIDPPELLHFIRQFHSDVIWTRPKMNFFQAVLKNGYPSRRMRFCCRVLKEDGGNGRFILTGIRWKESFKRSQRKMIEVCKDRDAHFLHPIIDWSDEEVWEFLRGYEIPYCTLYDEGFNRLGCMFCPLASQNNRILMAKRWPKYVKAFRRTFLQMYENFKHRPSIARHGSGDNLFEWWLYRMNSDSKEKDGKAEGLFCMDN